MVQESWHPYIKDNATYMLIVISIYILLNNKNSKNLIKFEKNYNVIYLLFISLIGLALFFLKFPLFRYGYSFLVATYVLMLLSFKINIDRDRLNYISKIVFLICLLIFSGKQFLRFGKNINSEYFWPRIYSFNENVKINAKAIKLSDDFTIFKNEDLCMYSNSPCTNYELKEKINLLKKYGYYFVNIKNLR